MAGIPGSARDADTSALSEFFLCVLRGWHDLGEGGEFLRCKPLPKGTLGERV